jgi:hypothetical protein
MKRRSYHYRARTFNAPFLKPPAEDRSSNSFRVLSPDRQPGRRTKRIFIIRQTVQVPSTNSAEGRKVQHVLIFDDHPESLRLVFASTPVEFDLSPPHRASPWPLILLSILIIGSMTAILWPLF